MSEQDREELKEIADRFGQWAKKNGTDFIFMFCKDGIVSVIKEPSTTVLCINSKGEDVIK